MASVVVVRGGRSLEREISLRSGHHVAAALRHEGHEVNEVDVDEQLTGHLAGCDAAFIALHGRDGEDGTIQSILDALGVPYTGSEALACQLCFDKPAAKELLRKAGVATPDSYHLSAEAVRRMGAGAALREAASRIGYPIVVKPAAQGSALGLAVVEAPEELSAAVMASFNYGERVLLERHIAGAELAIGLFGRDLDPLPAVEIRTATGVFDFEARVTPGGADYICPSDAPGLREAATAARRAAEVLGVRDFARVDLIVADEGPVVLEVNPCPGLTETSLITLAAAEAGIAFDAFARSVVEMALARAPAARA